MGLARDRFLRVVSEHLLCGICLGVLDNPSNVQCGHSFCFECVHRWFLSRPPKTSCPECRQFINVDGARQVWALKQLIGTMEIFCAYQSKGCDVIMKVENLSAHEIACPFKPKQILPDDDLNNLPPEIRCRVTRLESSLGQVRRELDVAEVRNKRLELELASARNHLEQSSAKLNNSLSLSDSDNSLEVLRASLLLPLRIHDKQLGNDN